MKKIQDFNRFCNLFPENAVNYCFDLWKKYHFEFIVTKKRITKLGDCRSNLSDPYADKTDLKYIITVNGDLNKYAFLITYLHEIAHLITNLEFNVKVAPHGKEWKKNFKKLLDPLLFNSQEIFPKVLLHLMITFSKNPKASTYSDFELIKTIHKYDKKPFSVNNNGYTDFLCEIENGEHFKISKRTFIRGELIRTRYKCKEMGTGRIYLIPKAAVVELVIQ